MEELVLLICKSKFQVKIVIFHLLKMLKKQNKQLWILDIPIHEPLNLLFTPSSNLGE